MTRSLRSQKHDLDKRSPLDLDHLTEGVRRDPPRMGRRAQE